MLVLQPASAATPVRIMPLGDSITGSPGCWRQLLWQQLANAGYTSGIDMVGSLNNQSSCGGGASWDGDNEGHGGYLATGIVSSNYLPGWLSSAKPDIVMMMLGTNDVWNHLATTTILDAYTTLLGQMRASNPSVKLIVAQILPMNPSGCSDCAQGVVNLDAAIPGWASAHSTSQSPITVVDQFTGFNDAADTSDGVHPNSTTGIQKVAAKWYPALTAVLTATTGTTTTTRTTVPTTTTRTTTTTSTTTTTTRTTAPVTTTRATTTTAGGSGTCSAGFAIGSAWSGGFVATVTVTAGSTAIKAWKVTMTLPSGVAVTNLWNGTATGASGTVPVSNAAYNGALGAGQSTSFGFQASGTGTGTTVTCTAG